MLDLKELFFVDRWRHIHGAHASPPCAIWPTDPRDEAQLDGSPWEQFPDPAGIAQLRSRAQFAENLLATCEPYLQDCKKEAVSCRNTLKLCHVQLEQHRTSATAICELLDRNGVCLSNQTAEQNRVAAAPACCVGRVRCFFCRERIAIEASFEKSLPSGDTASGCFADVSSCCSPTSEEEPHEIAIQATSGASDSEIIEVQHHDHPPRIRRKTWRERGKTVCRTRSKVRAPCSSGVEPQDTWFAKHTEDPCPGGTFENSTPSVAPQYSFTSPSCFPVAFKTNPFPPGAAKTFPLCAPRGNEHELEPYESAAARFWVDFLQESAEGDVKNPLEPCDTADDRGSAGSSWRKTMAEASPDDGDVTQPTSRGVVHPTAFTFPMQKQGCILTQQTLNQDKAPSSVASAQQPEATRNWSCTTIVPDKGPDVQDPAAFQTLLPVPQHALRRQSLVVEQPTYCNGSYMHNPASSHVSSSRVHGNR